MIDNRIDQLLRKIEGDPTKSKGDGIGIIIHRTFAIEIMQRPHSLQEIRKIWVMIQKAIAVMVLLR